MKTITRAKYLDRIIELNGTPDIKIITGIRRSGKSKLMQAYIAYLKSNFENINIIFIDFMDLAYEEIKEYHALHTYVEEHYQEGKTNYLFVDEVQMCPKFELAINSLYSKGKYDIYVTGSNAFLLSADLATLFTGRYIEIHVFPFSFQEYCQYYDDISDKDKLFDEYAIKGGLAGSYAYRTEKDRTNYIKEVYETIVTRDLVQKYALPDTLVLQRLSEFLMDNISNLTSPNKVSQLLTANEIPTNHVTVGKYIKYLCNAFVFYDIKRYDIRGKKYLESSEKFYLCDSGIRYAILGSRNMDYGRVYENIVCIELLRRGYLLKDSFFFLVNTILRGTSAITIPASSIPIGPIILFIISRTSCMPEGNWILQTNNITPTMIEIIFTFRNTFFHSNLSSSQIIFLQCVQIKTSCTVI